MCITSIQFRELEGAAKGAIGWFDVTNVSVCNDHPHHAMFEWCINIDVVNDKMGPSARVALELTPKSARELAEAILQVVKETEAEEAGGRDGRREREEGRRSTFLSASTAPVHRADRE